MGKAFAKLNAIWKKKWAADDMGSRKVQCHPFLFADNETLFLVKDNQSESIMNEKLIISLN